MRQLLASSLFLHADDSACVLDFLQFQTPGSLLLLQQLALRPCRQCTEARATSQVLA